MFDVSLFVRNYLTWVRQLVLKVEVFPRNLLVRFRPQSASLETFSQEKKQERGNILTLKHSMFSWWQHLIHPSSKVVYLAKYFPLRLLSSVVKLTEMISSLLRRLWIIWYASFQIFVYHKTLDVIGTYLRESFGTRIWFFSF